jgi:integrase
MTRRWNKVAVSAGVPGAVPYALRHSSIVRGIRAGLPIRLVAASHDTSVQMIERHYSRWITDGLEELTARAVVPLVR